jgi:hypothetical protein
MVQTTCPSPLWVGSPTGTWILSCEEAIQLAYRISVVLLGCSFVPEIMHGRAPEGLPPPPNDLYCVGVT